MKWRIGFQLKLPLFHNWWCTCREPYQIPLWHSTCLTLFTQIILNKVKHMKWSIAFQLKLTLVHNWWV